MSSMTMTPATNQNNLMAREKVNADAATTNVVNSTVKNDTVASDETANASAFPNLSSSRARLSAPLSRDLVSPLAAPVINTPIPSPVPVKYASPSAP